MARGLCRDRRTLNGEGGRRGWRRALSAGQRWDGKMVGWWDGGIIRGRAHVGGMHIINTVLHERPPNAPLPPFSKCCHKQVLFTWEGCEPYDMRWLTSLRRWLGTRSKVKSITGGGRGTRWYVSYVIVHASASPNKGELPAYLPPAKTPWQFDYGWNSLSSSTRYSYELLGPQRRLGFL